MVVEVPYTLGIWAGVGLREHGDDTFSIRRRNSSWAAEKRLASVVLVLESEWSWPNLAISLQNFPGHSVRASSQEHSSASIGSWFWAVQVNIHRCIICSCAIRLDPIGQDVAHQRYATHTYGALLLWRDKTYSIDEMGCFSRARLRTQLLQAVSHEPGYARGCYRQYLTSQVRHSAATDSISQARLRTQLLQAVPYEPGWALYCYRQYLTSQVTHSDATCSISRASFGTQLLQTVSHKPLYALSYNGQLNRKDVACMSEVSGSNLSCGNHPGWDLLWFFPVPSDKYQDGTQKIRTRPLPHLSKSLLTIVLSHNAKQSDLLPASLSNLGAATGNTTSC